MVSASPLAFECEKTGPSVSGRPLVLGHRGASAHAGANSLEAFHLASDHGADGIEFDVRFTADDQPIVHHDAVIPGFGALIDHRLSDIRKALPYIPMLDEVLAVPTSPLLNMEIKNDPADPDYDAHDRIAGLVADWVKSNGNGRQVLVTSFNAATIAHVRRFAPRVETGLLIGRRRGIRKTIVDASGAGTQWVLPHHAALRFREKATNRLARQLGLRLGTWTVDGPLELKRLRNGGVDAVITNDPKRALAVYS